MEGKKVGGGVLVLLCGWLAMTGCGQGLAAAGPRRDELVTVVHDSLLALEAATRDRFVEPAGDGGLRLVDWDLVADETGEAYYGNVYRSDVGTEVISSEVWIRKEFIVDDPRAEAAVLCLSGGMKSEGDPRLIVEVNGRELAFTAPRQEDPGLKYQDGWKRWLFGWLQIPIPTDALRKGLNTFVVRAQGDTRWAVSIELSLLPDRSARSDDGGATWHRDRLGVRGALDGEYVVRLALKRHPAAGTVTGPIIDLTSQEAARGGETVPVGLPTRLADVAVRAQTEAPDATSVSLDVRAGRTATYAPATWTPWTSVATFDAAAAEKHLGGQPGFRYLQWRARLETSDPLRSPVLKGVTCKVKTGRFGPSAPVARLEGENPVIVRGSHPFVFLRPHKRTDVLRAMLFEKLNAYFALDRAAVEGLLETSHGQMRLVRLLGAVVSRTLKSDQPMSEAGLAVNAPRDAVQSLYMGRIESRQARVICDGFGTTLAQCCAAMGMPAREFGVGHIMTEVWSNQLRDWFIIDSWWPKLYLDAKTGIPLNAVAMQKCLDEQTPIIKAWTDRDGEITKREKTPAWWPFDRFLVELRNDHNERGRPLHFMDTFSSRAHLVILNDKLKRLPFTDLQSRRLGDFEWTLNQARLHAISGPDGTLSIQVETVTPSLAGFRAALDGEPLETCIVAQYLDDNATGALTLPPGKAAAQLVCAPVNAFGVAGIPTRMTVERTAPH